MCNKKNVLHIIESSETGGAETVFLDLVTRLDAKEYNNIAGLFYEGWLSRKLAEKNVEPAVFSTRGSFDIALLLKLATFVRRNDIHLIHSHLFGANVYSSCAGKISNVPVISTFHGTMDVNPDNKLTKCKFWLVNKLSSVVVYVSKNLKNYYLDMKLGSSSKSLVIYNGIDLDQYSKKSAFSKHDIRTELSLSKDDVLVGAVGDLRKPKGYEDLLHAALILKSRYGKVKFVIAGSLTDEIVNYQERIRNNGLAKTVFFLGHRSDIPNILRCLDIFVLPSLSEGFSLSTIEAMAMEVPVIVTRCGGPEEIVTNGKSGIVVAVNSPNEIALAITRILSDDVLAKKFAIQGRKAVEAMFSIDKMIRSYSELYQNVVEGRYI